MVCILFLLLVAFSSIIRRRETLVRLTAIVPATSAMLGFLSKPQTGTLYLLQLN